MWTNSRGRQRIWFGGRSASETGRAKERLNIDVEQINHLSAEQQGQLLTILNKYQDRFTEKTGLCTLVEREIELKPDFRVKEFAAYRIPFAYRPEVERQIQDMLQQGIIKPSTSRMASPLVIV